MAGVVHACGGYAGCGVPPMQRLRGPCVVVCVCARIYGVCVCGVCVCVRARVMACLHTTCLGNSACARTATGAAHARTRTRAHTRTHTPTHSRTHIQTHILTRIHARTYICIYV